MEKPPTGEYIRAHVLRIMGRRENNRVGLFRESEAIPLVWEQEGRGMVHGLEWYGYYDYGLVLGGQC